MYQHIRIFSILCMIISLGALIMLQSPYLMAVFLFSSALLFGVVVLETRHADTVKDLELSLSTLSAFTAKNQKKTDDLEQSVQNLIDLNKKLTQDLNSLDSEFKKLDPEKIKEQLKILIDSNNVIVTKMSMGQAFPGM